MAPVDGFRHFELEQLADGVWAALHRDGGWATANAGIVDLGDETLVFDAFITPEAGRELAAAAERLTGRPAAYLVNSHYHNDHVRGGVAFAGARLVATDRTRRLIDTLGREELEYDRAHAEDRLAAARAALVSLDPEERESGRFGVPHWEGIQASLPEAAVRLPDLTFARELVFYGSTREARLRSVGAAHTADDAALYLPSDGIAFLSDLLFVEVHPWLADGDPDGWLSALERISGWGADRFVPGHGRVGTRQDLAALGAYVRELQEEAAARVRAGQMVEDLESVEIPAPYRSWVLGVPFYRGNLRFLIGRLAR